VAVVVATFDNVTLARATVRSASADGRLQCLVVDVDGAYRSIGAEQVVSLEEAVGRLDLAQQAVSAAATLGSGDFTFYAGVLGAAFAEAKGGDGALVLAAGVHVLGDLRGVATETSVVVPFLDPAGLERRAAVAPVQVRRDRHSGLLSHEGSGLGALHSRALYAVRSAEQVALLLDLASGWRGASDALDAFAVATGAVVVRHEPLLIGAWRGVGKTQLDDRGRLLADGAVVRAVDLTAFDPQRPWLLDARAGVAPVLLLSSHPALAQVVRAEADRRLADEAAESVGGSGLELSPHPLRARIDPVLRTEARRAERSNAELPDLLGLGRGPDLEDWAFELTPPGHRQPVTRYLDALRRARPDLRRTFRNVPGRDSEPLARWALERSTRPSVLDTALLARAARISIDAQDRDAPAPRGPVLEGVNLVGFLTGELGVGASARLVDDALHTAEVTTSTFDIPRDLRSRREAQFRSSEPIVRETSLICVNAGDTPAVVEQFRPMLQQTRVIGMWYWELEEFPESQRIGFAHVDEVWAATDFMRDAIAKYAGKIPVRTVPPPLPQAGDDPGTLPARLGIPTDRPWFLFTFDFLSVATRKNPYGLVDAFTRAFKDWPAQDRPTLVIKTINADAYPEHAERLRLQIAERPDIMLLDIYLDNDERHVLVSHCTAFVSLHKAEGLGLTIAEAMAWGKPVIVTRYGGVMQFCNERNAFLVNWRPGTVEESTGPYQRGMVWAEPDLDHAAALIRSVIEDPGRAASVGARAARDIKELHNAEIAGARMREVLREGNEHWKATRAEQGTPARHESRPGRTRRIASAVRRRKPE
jgi:glycosyltransferase involved in cell wall biosynthesis